MKITKDCLRHNALELLREIALELLREIASNSGLTDESQAREDISYMLGVIDMMDRLEKVLDA